MARAINCYGLGLLRGLACTEQYVEGEVGRQAFKILAHSCGFTRGKRGVNPMYNLDS